MEDSEFQQLVSALRDYDGTGPDELHSYLMDRPGLESSVAGGIVALAISLESLRESHDWSPAQAAAEIAPASGSPAETAEQRDLLTSRIQQLLAIPGVTLASRITDLLTSYERSWRSAQFLTDVRTVYGDDPESMSGVIVTTLEVSYLDADGRLKRTYFALDDDDLEALSDALVDTQASNRNLRHRLQGAGMRLASTTLNKAENDGRT